MKDNSLDTLQKIGIQSVPDFDTNNPWFSSIDAEILYAMVKYIKPKRIIEIGTGLTTRCAVIALEENGLPYKFTTIDPNTGRLGYANVFMEIIQQTIQEVNLAIFRELKAGDILLIDGSHIWKPGSDVDIILNKVFPILAKGVVVHIHDIFLPDPYPDDWHARGYNEQEHVDRVLKTGAWDILWSSHYMKKNHPEKLREFVSYRESNDPASLWIQKK